MNLKTAFAFLSVFMLILDETTNGAAFLTTQLPSNSSIKTHQKLINSLEVDEKYVGNSNDSTGNSYSFNELGVLQTKLKDQKDQRFNSRKRNVDQTNVPDSTTEISKINVNELQRGMAKDIVQLENEMNAMNQVLKQDPQITSLSSNLGGIAKTLKNDVQGMNPKRSEKHVLIGGSIPNLSIRSSLDDNNKQPGNKKIRQYSKNDFPTSQKRKRRSVDVNPTAESKGDQARDFKDRARSKLIIKETDIEKQETRHKEQEGKSLLKTSADPTEEPESGIISSLEKQIDDSLKQKSDQNLFPTINPTETFNTSYSQNLKMVFGTPVSEPQEGGLQGFLKTISSEILNNFKQVYSPQASTESSIGNVTQSSESVTESKNFMLSHPFLGGFFIALDIILLIIFFFMLRFCVWNLFSRFKRGVEKEPSRGESVTTNIFKSKPYTPGQFAETTSGCIITLSNAEQAYNSKPLKDYISPRMSSDFKTSRRSVIQHAKGYTRLPTHDVRDENLQESTQTRQEDKCMTTKSQIPSQTSNKDHPGSLSIKESIRHMFKYDKNSKKRLKDQSSVEIIIPPSKSTKDDENEPLRKFLKTQVPRNIEPSEESFENLKKGTIATGDKHIDGMMLGRNFTNRIFASHNLNTVDTNRSFLMLDYALPEKDEIDYNRIKPARPYGVLDKSAFDEDNTFNTKSKRLHSLYK